MHIFWSGWILCIFEYIWHDHSLSWAKHDKYTITKTTVSIGSVKQLSWTLVSSTCTGLFKPNIPWWIKIIPIQCGNVVLSVSSHTTIQQRGQLVFADHATKINIAQPKTMTRLVVSLLPFLGSISKLHPLFPHLPVTYQLDNQPDNHQVESTWLPISEVTWGLGISFLHVVSTYWSILGWWKKAVDISASRTGDDLFKGFNPPSVGYGVIPVRLSMNLPFWYSLISWLSDSPPAPSKKGNISSITVEPATFSWLYHKCLWL